MGNFIFVVLHVVAVLFGFVLLIITVPAHLIYLAASKKTTAPVPPGDAVSPSTHVRCPDCREVVRADASKCKHCGTKLVPQKL